MRCWLEVLALIVGAVQFGSVASAQNTANNYTGSSSGSLLTGTNWSLLHAPTVSEDAVFTATTGIRTLTAGSLTVGSFNVTTAASGTFSIRNETSTATNSTLTLGGVGNLGNSVSGTAGDLLFAKTGVTFNITGPNGGSGSGVLNVVLGQSGNFNSVGTMNVSAAISEASAGLSLTKTGGGTLTLSGNNTYTGGTTLSGGVVSVSAIGNAGASGNLGTGSITIGTPGQTGNLRYTGAGETSNKAITLGGASVIDTTGATGGLTLSADFSATGVSNRQLFLQGNTTGNVISGKIVDAGPGVSTGVQKFGTGTWTLSGANQYTGGTLISQGQLIVNGSIAGTNVVGVQGATAVLSGTGTVPSIFALVGGTISPGNGSNSIGNLTSGSLLLSGSEFYKLELQSDGTGTAGVNWDKLTITTGINNDSLSGPVTLKLQTLTGLSANGALDTWNGNTNHVWSNFLTTPAWGTAFSPSQFTIDTSGFVNSFVGTFSVVDNGAGLDLVYTVPEASVGLSLLLGSGLLAGFRRRRR